ncbi:MAG: Crp/Fnr family transcriptional regulator [Chitinophagaceae bacterium]
MLEPLFNFLSLFQKLSIPDRELIAKNVSFKTVKESEVLLKEGRTAREMFFICDGVLKIVHSDDKGDDVIHYFLRENQFCTILKSFTEDIPSKDRIQAACDTTVIVFEKNKLYALYKALPFFQNLLNKIIQQSLVDKIEITNSYLGKDASTRYQKFIISQSDIALRVSQTDIASYLGITKQSLSRIRKQFNENAF